MYADDFLAICLGKTKRKRKSSKRTFWGAGKAGFSGPGYTGSSVPGGECGCCAGDCGGGCACGCGEATNGPEEFQAFLEGLATQYPHSNVVEQVSKMFQNMRNGQYDPLYCSADGISTKQN